MKSRKIMLSVTYNIRYAIKLSSIKYLAQEITAADMRERERESKAMRTNIQQASCHYCS